MTENNIHQNTTSGRKQSDVLYSATSNACSSRGKQIFIFFLGFVVGLGSFWLWDKNNAVPSGIERNGGEAKEAAALAKENTAAVPNETEKNRVSVISQESGNLVVVTEAEVLEPTWVAIHEDVDGKPANILGAQLFDAGTHSGTVALLRNTEPGHKYYAILYKDNGDRVFDYTIDLPVERASGGVVSASFMTVAEPPPL